MVRDGTRWVGVVLAACALWSGDTPSQGLNAPATSRTITAADLLSLKQIGGYSGNISLAPDGRSVAFQLQSADYAARTYKSDWFVVPVAGNGKATIVGSGGDVQLSPSSFGRINGSRAEVRAQWSPDGRWIAYLRKDAGEVQVWRSRADGSMQEQVTHNAADVMMFAWTPDGAGIRFEVGRDRAQMKRAEQEEGDRGFLLDDRFIPQEGTKPLRYPCGSQMWDIPIPVSQQCTPRVWTVEFGAAEHEADATADRTSNAAPEQQPPGVGPERRILGVAWNREHKQVAWLENEDPATYAGDEAPLTLFADGERCPARECHGQLEQVWWNGDGLVFLRLEGHAYSIPALYGWQPKGGLAKLIYRVDGVLRSCEVFEGRAICLQETPTTPRKIVAIDLQSGVVTTVFDPNPEFRNFALGTVERIEWRDGFGNDTFGHLVYPPGYQRGRRYPLVIVQYRSRGFLKGGVGDEYPIFALAAKGFVVLSFDRPDDWNLNARYSRDTLVDDKVEAAEWKDGYKFRRKLRALEIVLDQLEQRGIIDAAKVGITGLSDGAETVDYALFNSRRFAAAAASGTWSPTYYDLTTNSVMRAFARSMLGAKSAPEAIGKWSVLSLATNAEKASAPLLLQVSDRELVVTVPTFVALKDAGRPVEAYVFPDEYHIKWQPQHKLAVADRAIDWFRFWLKDEEDPSPEKIEQYDRWRTLRAQRDSIAQPAPH